ncbi:hypothetical protein D3C80_1561390 [compost metagenome]
MTDLALLDQIRQGANHLFDRHLRIDPVLVVKIDGFYPQPLQAAFYRAADIVRFAAHTPRSGIGRIAHNTELGGQKYLVAFAFDRLAYQLFIGVRAVHICGVQQSHPQFQGPMQRGDRFLLVITGGVEIAHPHAT